MSYQLRNLPTRVVSWPKRKVRFFLFIYRVHQKKQITEKIGFLIQLFLFLQFLTDFDHPGTNRKVFLSSCYFSREKIFFVTRLFIFIKCVHPGSIWLNSLQALIRSIMAGDQIVIPAQKPPNTSCFMAQKKSQIFSLYTVCTKKTNF